MSTGPCPWCKARPGTHFHWCPTVGGAGRPGQPAPAPTDPAQLGHFAAPPSGLLPTGVPVVVCTSAVLCPDCLGDWCEACNHTGMAQPAARVTTTQAPRVAVAQAPPTAPLDLATAVARWCTDTLGRSAA